MYVCMYVWCVCLCAHECVCVGLINSLYHEVVLRKRSTAIHPYQTSLLAGPLDCIQCLYKADIRPCWLANAGVSMGRGPQENATYGFFLTSLECLGWFGRWEVSGCTAAVLRGATSKICSKQHVTLLWSFHQTFSPCFLYESRRCIHIIVLIWTLRGRNPILAYQIDRITIWSITCQSIYVYMCVELWRERESERGRESFSAILFHGS